MDQNLVQKGPLCRRKAFWVWVSYMKSLKREYLYKFVCMILGVMSLAISGYGTIIDESRELITKSKSIVAKIGPSDFGIREFTVNVTYKVLELNVDDTFTGTIKIILTDSERAMLAKGLKKSVTNVPEYVEIKNVIAEIENKIECPRLQLKFNGITFNIDDAKAAIGDFSLNLEESETEVCQLVCKYVKYLFVGRGHPTTRFRPRINELLKPHR